MKEFKAIITKDMKTLSSFVSKKEFGACREALRYVCIDFENHCAAASDGRKVKIKAITCLTKWDGPGHRFPLIEAAQWRKMCMLAGNEGAVITCTLNNGLWTCESNGVRSKAPSPEAPNYVGAVPYVSCENCVKIDKKTWQAVKRRLKENKEGSDRLIIEHKTCSAKLVIKAAIYDLCELSTVINKQIEVPCTCVPPGNFSIPLDVKYFNLLKNFCLYLHPYAGNGVTAIDGNDIYLFMPFCSDCIESNALNYNLNESPFKLAGFPDYNAAV